MQCQNIERVNKISIYKFVPPKCIEKFSYQLSIAGYLDLSCLFNRKFRYFADLTVPEKSMLKKVQNVENRSIIMFRRQKTEQNFF